MKKALLVFIAILFPLLSAEAQIKTGGQISVPALISTVMKKEIDKVAAKSIIEKIESHLVDRDVLCSSNERLLKDSDLMQTYLKLSLFKNPKFPSDKCDEVNKYFACLNDKKSKELLTKLKENEQTSEVLKSRYKISEVQSKKMLQFFEHLGKKVK